MPPAVSCGRRRRLSHEAFRVDGHVKAPLLVPAFFVVAIAVLAACGGGATNGPVNANPNLVTPAQATGLTGGTSVQGFLWADSPDAIRLCEASLESFPPQCGEPSIPVTGIDITRVAGTDFFENIFWAEGVRVIGTMAGGQLTAEEVSLASSDNGMTARILVPLTVTDPNPGWTILLSNPGDDPIDISFSSGQDAEVLIRDDSGETVYAWSSQFSFTQAERMETLQPGETRRILLEGVSHNLEPGRYELEATVVSTPGSGTMRGVVEVR